jgi:hypothetical protein
MRPLPIALVALCASLANAQPTTAPATRPAYVGAFEYVYPGFRVRADVPDARRPRWTILGGPRDGQSAEETVDRRTIAPGIEFVSWTERDGTMIAQVADFNAMRLTTCLITGGKRIVLEGQIKRIAE